MMCLTAARAATDVAMLGDSTSSWAYSSDGKKCGDGGGFLPYAIRYGVGDEVAIKIPCGALSNLKW